MATKRTPSDGFERIAGVLWLPRALLVAILCGCGALRAQPPLLWYLFDEGGNPTTVLNAGTAGVPFASLIGHTLAGVGPNGSPALAGGNTFGARLATGWVVDLSGDWTIGFLIDTQSVALPFTGIAGDGSTTGLRIATGGPLGADSITLSGSGLRESTMLGGGGRNGWVHVTFTHDHATGILTGHRNGAETLRVQQPAHHTVSGGLFLFGGGAGGSSMGSGAYLDDIRIYDRKLSPEELTDWVEGSGLIVPRRFQANQVGATLLLNGVRATQASVARVDELIGGQGLLTLSAHAGSPWDLGFVAVARAVPAEAGASFSAGGQMMNLDASESSFGFVRQLSFTNSFPGVVHMPFAATQPLEAALQMVAFDVSLPDGAAISAPVEITVRPRPACVVEAVGANNFNGDPNGAFWRLHNLGERGDVLDATFDFRNAADPGQASIYYDLDQSGLGDNFYCGNGTQAGCRGSYRLGSDTTVGLIYDALNTYAPGALLNPCDPTVSCGFTVIAPGPSAHTARALQFRFAHFSAGESFLFAADTDYGLGEHGAAMRGLHITLQTTTGSLCGSLVADPFDPLRAFVELY